jgi:N6-L-threonylcarbamoyladenine synthase
MLAANLSNALSIPSGHVPAGEAYDKVARLLGLELVPSGGAALEAFAAEGDAHALPLSVPMRQRPTCDFSYAGLKTAVRLAIEERAPQATGGLGWAGRGGAASGSGSMLPRRACNGTHQTCAPAASALRTPGCSFSSSTPPPAAWPAEANRRVRADIAASFQRVAVAHLEERCRRAVQWTRESHPQVGRHIGRGNHVAASARPVPCAFPCRWHAMCPKLCSPAAPAGCVRCCCLQVRHLVVAGGVASNKYIRGRLGAVAEEAGLHLVCPPPRLCTDNGVMVAWAGVERLQLGLAEAPPASAEPGGDKWVDLRPRWPLTDRKDPRRRAPRA